MLPSKTWLDVKKNSEILLQPHSLSHFMRTIISNYTIKFCYNLIVSNGPHASANQANRISKSFAATTFVKGLTQSPFSSDVHR